jgi:hypothetical protein
MKRITTIMLVGVFAVSLLGCSSGSSDTAKQSKKSSGSPIKSSNIDFKSAGYGDVGKTNAQRAQLPESMTASKLKASPAKLVKGWPSEVPLIQGKVVGSRIAKIVNSKGKPTGKYSLVTMIETDSNNKEIAAFYKSKFAKVTNPGIAATRNGYCAGVIGRWLVSVSSNIPANNLDTYLVSVSVQAIK